MRYASVCDGIGAVHVAWQPLGWHCEWTAEIDAFPAAVVEQRWGFPNRGDMTRFKEWDDAPIELLVGGTPCQSFSVAGLRKGLHDPRGGLMLTFLEIAQRYRPRWVVWENVPGVLSSNGGRDFGSFLGALGELGYGWAYRVLDAQWFGVAQRRRRVFVVGCLGDERRAAQVLFESESVRRDNPPSRAKGQGVAVATPISTRTGRSDDRGDGGDNIVAKVIWRAGVAANAEHVVDQAGTLVSHRSQLGRVVSIPGRTTGWQGGSQQDQILGGEDVSPCLAHSSNAHAGHHQPKVAVACTPIDLRQASRGDKDTNNRAAGSGGPPGHGVGYEGAPAFTVSERGQAIAFKPSHFTRGKDGKPSEVTPPLSADADKGDQDTVIATPFTKSKRAQSTTDDESWVPGEVSPTMNCFDQGDARATTVVAFTQNSRDEVRQINGDGQPAGALSAEAGMHQTNYIAFAQNQLGEVRTNSEVMGTVNTNQNASGRNTPMVMQAQGFTHSGYSNKPAWITGDRTDCLPSSGHGDTSHQGIGVMQPVGVDFQNCANTGDVSGTLMGEAQKKGGEAGHGVLTPMAVRRLTPRECERLQGFPDDYTAIEYRKKPAADGPRYKALGNSMAVPVMAWIGQRIAAAAEK
jgi:DNA (cytosine-5)-methyltransferase 1